MCAHGVICPASTATITPTSPITKTTTAAASTVRCPSRSMSRACGTARIALATRKDADTAPARE